MSKAYNNIYSVSRYCFGYIVRKTMAGNNKTFYLKSIYNRQYTWYTDPLYAKGYKTEKAAYKTIQRIIEQGE